MGRLNFKDINEWTPSSISVVDKPDHPLAVFEVYENDEEFVKKSINIEVDKMVDQNVIKEEEQMVSGPVSFFEKLLNRNVVTKAEEKPPEPPAQNAEKGEPKNEVLEEIKKLNERFDKMEERVSKLEGEEKPPEPPEDVVTKGEEKPPEDPTNEVVIKSREVDPDDITITKSEKTQYERMGRNENGMTW